MSAEFHVIGPRARVPSGVKGWCGYLNHDAWDDWGEYRTQFHLTLVNPEGSFHGIGQLKIGERGLMPHSASSSLPPGHREPGVGHTFTHLGEEFFSIGQDDEYYENLNTLDDDVRVWVLSCLRDVAYDPVRWEAVKHERVMTKSLLRSVTASTAEGQFRRMARGDAALTPFSFTYTPPKRMGDGAPPYVLEFSVLPESPIPTNVHVLIGRNGVGKTRVLSLMAKALVATDATAHQSGSFVFTKLRGYGEDFANVVAVSFSAFDEGELLPERRQEPNNLGYSYIGLRSGTSDAPTATSRPKSPTVLAREFISSLRLCQSGSRRRRWTGVIETLQSDPVFQAAQLAELIERDLSKEEESEEVLKRFKKLSSGHKIVLLTLTRLVEKVEEKTLVLIDEPEAHLHPPLLSAMTRAISELMVKRNGVAIVATHSPVILQEVPSSCVYILNRIGSVARANRPTIETFAESVGILSREVFQLELSQSGYHQLLQRLRDTAATYEIALRRLEGQLGAEGKAVLRAMYLDDSEEDEEDEEE